METVHNGADGLCSDLREMGCGTELIRRLSTLDADDDEGRLCLLKRYRCQLLEEMHRSQRRLDRLDSMIYEIRKENGGVRR